jgi:hypothetical protein
MTAFARKITPLEIIYLYIHIQATRKPAQSLFYFYRVADKSLAQPGRKPATATEDFDVHISYLLS